MSAKRPNQNSDGQAKKPSANPTGQATLPPPGVAPSSAPHMALKSNLAGMPPGVQPGGTGGDLGMLQTRVNFRDMPPVGQSQVEQQMGIDPYAMVKMGQQAVNGAAQQAQAGAPSVGGVPATLSGPGIPQEAGLDNFPHDLAALQQMMTQGYSPGADPLEHQQAQNAHSMARAMEVQTQQQAQNVNAHADTEQQIMALLQKLRMQHGVPQAPQQGGAPQFAMGNAMMGGAAPGSPVVNG